MSLTEFIIYAVIFLGGLNLLRVAALLIATDVHEIREHNLRKETAKLESEFPWVTVVIPAYNEEALIVSTLNDM